MVPSLRRLFELYKITHDRDFIDFASSVANHYPYMAGIHKDKTAPLLHVYHLTEFLAGVVDLYFTENRIEELKAIESVWEDMRVRHLYPTGSLGYREFLRETAPNDIPIENGEPDKHHQETCSTVGWLLLTSKLYLATGNVRYMQSMEQTIYNALLAAQSTDGMKWMYYTPLRYEKKWFSGPTSCCYWSGPRGIARIPGWIYASDGEGIYVNLFESSSATFTMDDKVIGITQSSDYPDLGQVTLQLRLELPINFPLNIRIPFQGVETHLLLNGKQISPALEQEGYFTLRQEWSTGDKVEMKFDIPVVVLDYLNNQYGVLLRGPEVLAVDERDNETINLDEILLQRKMALQSIEPINGRRRYAGEVIIHDHLESIQFTPYADCGGDADRFRTAFPVR